jgi:starch-binding outer membrane protein, SusD/RagB family
MKHIFNILSACAAAAVMMTACNSDEFLNTSSPSTVDADFVFSYSETAEAAMLGVYEAWRSVCNNQVYAAGLYYALDIAGSDIERHPEAFSNQPGRHWMECLYQNGKYTGDYGLTSYLKDDSSGAYNMLFDVIGKANAVIGAIEGKSDYEQMMASEPTDISQLYGEAVCARAVAYRELLKYYGDVPFTTKTGVAAGGLAPRDSIYDCIIADLEKVIPVMKPVGTVAKNKFSKTFAQGLAGRMCLEAGGYQTRRADLGSDFYKDASGKVLTFETKGEPNANADNAVYGRRSDWKDLYKKAQTFFKAVIDDSGSAVWHDTDPRKAEGKRVYGNPYQYFFQQMNNLEYADESIYEYAMTQGSSNERPYSSGRPSGGGGSWAFPCKSYGQARINPAYYYGMFDPKDMRRDVSVCVTGSDGKGAEVLIPFKPNSKVSGGGLTLNKWDENRMSKPYIVKQRQSGINGPYMRLAEIYLGYAEACAALGDESNAMTYLKKVRERSFPAGEANTEAFVAKYGMLRAVIEERGFEYAGEGDRRWTLIRSGYLPEAVKAVKDLTAKMIEGLKANGSYTFDNGNTISSYVWTKTVDAKSTYGFRLTAQCTDESDPVLYPGWRGQNDDWESIAKSYSENKKSPSAGDKTNLAIVGLFKSVSADEAAALVADGYKKVNWGKDIVDNEAEYDKYLFYDYDYVSAPIYLVPFTPNTISTGGFTNGYGFKQQ